MLDRLVERCKLFNPVLQSIGKFIQGNYVDSGKMLIKL